MGRSTAGGLASARHGSCSNEGLAAGGAGFPASAGAAAAAAASSASSMAKRRRSAAVATRPARSCFKPSRSSAPRRTIMAVATTKHRWRKHCSESPSFPGGATVIAVPRCKNSQCNSFASLGTKALTVRSLEKSAISRGAPSRTDRPSKQPSSRIAKSASTARTMWSEERSFASPQGMYMSRCAAVQRSSASLWESAFICAGRKAGFAPPLCCQQVTLRAPSMLITIGSSTPRNTGTRSIASSFASCSRATTKHPQGSKPAGTSLRNCAACSTAQSAKLVGPLRDFRRPATVFSGGCRSPSPSSPGCGGVGAA
mmetsp:Transcript_51884/g.151064  ORF Transcript_51884/g.151064 Transcript_51884/m.151064 type:complete len:313 (+) Transcript_51884:438-1376(+)